MIFAKDIICDISKGGNLDEEYALLKEKLSPYLPSRSWKVKILRTSALITCRLKRNLLSANFTTLRKYWMWLSTKTSSEHSLTFQQIQDLIFDSPGGKVTNRAIKNITDWASLFRVQADSICRRDDFETSVRATLSATNKYTS